MLSEFSLNPGIKIKPIVLPPQQKKKKWKKRRRSIRGSTVLYIKKKSSLHSWSSYLWLLMQAGCPGAGQTCRGGGCVQRPPGFDWCRLSAPLSAQKVLNLVKYITTGIKTCSAYMDDLGFFFFPPLHCALVRTLPPCDLGGEQIAFSRGVTCRQVSRRAHSKKNTQSEASRHTSTIAARFPFLWSPTR